MSVVGPDTGSAAAPDSAGSIQPGSEAPEPVTPLGERADTLYPNDPAKEDEPAKVESQADKPGEQVEPYRFTPPQGMDLDQELAAAATPVLREIGLDDAKANRLLQLVPKVQERYAQQMADEWAVIRADWGKKTRSDSDIGGANFQQTTKMAALAMDAAGAPKGSEFRQLLDDSGLGSHPAFVRVFRNLGRLIAAKGAAPAARSTTSPPEPGDRAQALYPGHRS